MFKWFTNIINKFRSKKKQYRSKYDNRIYGLSQQLEQLKRTHIDKPSTEWFTLSAPQKQSKQFNIFSSYSFKQIITLQFLKDERIKIENARIEQVKERIRTKLSIIDRHIRNEQIQEAENIYKEIIALRTTIPNDANLINEISQRQENISKLSQILREREVERLKKIEAERRRREDEERKRKEEIAKREKERKEREFREKKEKEEKELSARRQREAEQIKRQEEKRKELERITAHTKVFKPDKDSIATVLKENEVKYFFHFTDVSNLKSIKEQGGLLSWYYCEQHGIEIPVAGGDADSRSLDKLHNLHDYVRLSFCEDHPMAYHVRKRKGATLVLLKIKIEVALFNDTLFSDINAADNKHTTGGTAEFIRNNVNFAATRKRYVRGDDSDFKPHQAEILVKTFLPKEYIINLDSPSYM